MYKDESFSLGESFHRVARDAIPDNWLDNDNDDGHWCVPSIVNMAFACELYLKSLISHGNNSAWGHNLVRLFDGLDKSIQDRVLNSSLFKGDKEFYEKLDEAKLIFENWRYCFEPAKYLSVDIIFLENLASVLHSVAESEVLCLDQF